MEIKQAIAEAIKELIVPELKSLQADVGQVKAVQDVMNKRLDDVNAHLIEQSRRIDSMNDSINSRIDTLRADLERKIDETNDRINRLYEVIVRREEHENFGKELSKIDCRVRKIEEKVGM